MSKLNFSRRDALRTTAAAFGSLTGGPLSFSSVALAQNPKRLPIDIVNTSGAATLILNVLIRRTRYLESMGVSPNFVNVTDGTKVMGALMNDNDSVCVGSGFNQVLAAIEKGAPLKIIAAASLVPLQALFTSKPNIKTVKDLEGKTIGIGSPGALIHQLIVTLLTKQNVDVDKVRFANIGSTEDIFRAIVAGTVDAGSSDVNVYNMQKQLGIHAIDGGDMFRELPNYTFQATYASDRAIAQNREALIRTLAAYAKLYRYVQGPTSKADVVSAYSEALGKKEGGMGDFMWDFYQKHKPFAVDLVMSDERINYVQDLNLKFGAQKKRLPTSQIMDMSLAREAIARLSH